MSLSVPTICFPLFGVNRTTEPRKSAGGSPARTSAAASRRISTTEHCLIIFHLLRAAPSEH
jgi:hypothetical protein